jgi:deazaflavin-dependent oxidoreductase (nitroreductase family)
MTRSWVAACALAEGIGMAASAAAARGTEHVGVGTGFALVLLGGLVEGTALGVLQSASIRETLGTRRTGWVLATSLAAGLGWAVGSAPATLSDDGGGSTPPLALVLLGALGIGITLGPLLGLAQALALRTRVRHPFRWVVANAAGWAVAMPVIFLGATTAGATWSWPVLVLYGGVTGVVAGTALGAVTGLWLPTLDGAPLRHRLVLDYLVARRAPTSSALTGLAVTGTRTGDTYRFPVMAARLGSNSLVVLPGHPEHKRWWRNLRGGAVVQVLDRGTWSPAAATVLEHGTLEWSVARSAYRARWPRVTITDGPLVVLVLERADVSRLRDQGPALAGPAAVAAPPARP